ncbi:hypothetical protein B5C34_00705 [Pacificimonas flava]|uniref:Oxidoreductase n=2 Tax=Pacificimonas TaxID=1960290 RepID=A0A219B1N5_9SPHN|nr:MULTISPECIES: SDR family NAD(P)-dependent oxidoreductase [Pacificimonas]MBZ6378268.1 SDR family NAD(P)-dependent oxidoreductase [Pacificimonas aurantium]OWV32114.1 hypothetical protein B5C34_00705 [Pacificimonas flava]
MSERKLAVVTGATSGIGWELAKCAASDGYDLIVNARGEELEDRASELEVFGVSAKAVRADLGTESGVETLLSALSDRPVDVFCANAGLGKGGETFLDQEFHDAKDVIDLNCTGTARLIYDIGRHMRSRGEGRILVTGSIVDRIPGPFNAVYNASKAFIDSLAYAVRNELKDSGVTITVLMPGLTDTGFFDRANMENTEAASTSLKDDPETVAKDGWKAMLAGKAGVVGGNPMNVVQHAFAGALPDKVNAELHRILMKGFG